MYVDVFILTLEEFLFRVMNELGFAAVTTI